VGTPGVLVIAPHWDTTRAPRWCRGHGSPHPHSQSLFLALGTIEARSLDSHGSRHTLAAIMPSSLCPAHAFVTVT